MKSSAIIIIFLSVMLLAGFLLSIAPAKAEDSNIAILSNSIYQTYGFSPFNFNQGDYHVTGEVQNTGTQALHFNITGTFYDSTSKIIGTACLTDTQPDFGPSYLHLILPDKTSPFELFLSRFNQTGDFIMVDHYTLAIHTSPASLYKQGLEITQQDSQETAGTLMINGEIKNIGTDYIDGFNVYSTFYNSQGEVIAVSSEGGGYIQTDSSGESGFPPNNTTSFQVTLNDFPHGGRLQQVDRYELTAEGYDNSLWTVGGQLITPETVYVLGSLPTEAPQPTPSAEDYPIELYIGIAAIAIIIALTTAVLIKHKQKKVATKSF
jgi:hypothetical protein